MMRWLALLLLLPVLARAQWTPEDKAAGIAAAAFTTIDWAQTRDIARNGNQFYELNPLLGQHPSIGRVNNYFAGALIGGTALAFALPENERHWFLNGTAVLELAVTAHNAKIGVRMNF